MHTLRTLTLALARRLARSGYSVVVIDGDLRTQTISELVGAPPKSGISAVLRAVSRPNARKDKVVTETEHPNVTVMGATGIGAPFDLPAQGVQQQAAPGAWGIQ